MFVILINPDDVENRSYKGAVCIKNQVPYYVTGLQGPTLFATETIAEKVIKMCKENLKRKPIEHYAYEYILNGTWEVVEAKLYLSLSGGLSGIEWSKEIRDLKG